MSRSLDRLRDAHRLALTTHGRGDHDAEALVRAWPQLATSAHAAHRKVGADTDRLSLRLALDAQSLDSTVTQAPWPGPGTIDPDLVQISKTLRASTRDELDISERPEAQRLIASTLWTTSQLIARASSDRAWDLATAPPSGMNRAQQRVALDTSRRFAGIEMMARSALGAPVPRSTDPINDLRTAVARWDIEAHRALLTHRSSAVLHVVAHQEAATSKVAEAHIRHAADAEAIDAIDAARLHPVLGSLASSRTELRNQAAGYSFASTPVPTDLIQAATDLREELHDALRRNDPEAQRTTTAALTSHFATGVTMAASTRELIADGQLRGPARAVARYLAEHEPEAIESQVDPHDIMRGVTVPLPPAARRLLDQAAQRALADAHEALDRSAGVDGETLRTTKPPALDEKAPSRPQPMDHRAGNRSAPAL